MKLDFDIKSISPFLQGAVVLFFMLVFMGFGAIGSSDPRFPWVSVCAMLLFFALFNTLLSIPVEDLTHYWWKSILSFVLLAVIGGFIAQAVSGLSIDEAGSARWIYIVFSVGYLVFISIVQIIKLVIFLAQRQENLQNPNK